MTKSIFDDDELLLEKRELEINTPKGKRSVAVRMLSAEEGLKLEKAKDNLGGAIQTIAPSVLTSMDDEEPIGKEGAKKLLSRLGVEAFMELAKKINELNGFKGTEEVDDEGKGNPAE